MKGTIGWQRGGGVPIANDYTGNSNRQSQQSNHGNKVTRTRKFKQWINK